MRVGDKVFARVDILTTYNLPAPSGSVTELDAWAGENGEVVSVVEQGVYNVKFDKGVTLCTESELGYVS